MIRIGEKLNSSIPAVGKAIAAHDEARVVALIRAQQEGGADFLDVNAALSGPDEVRDLVWLAGLVVAHSRCGLMLDSPDPAALLAALPAAKDRPVILNSVSLTRGLEDLAPAAAQTGAAVAALPLEGAALPPAPRRAELAARLLEKLTARGLPPERVYMDALVSALSADTAGPRQTLETISAVKAACPGVKTLCGLSNVSFGLPRRAQLNAAFLAMAMDRGLDAVILDVTSPPVMDALFAADALRGEDEYCLRYIGYVRGMERKV